MKLAAKAANRNQTHFSPKGDAAKRSSNSPSSEWNAIEEGQDNKATDSAGRMRQKWIFEALKDTPSGLKGAEGYPQERSKW